MSIKPQEPKHLFQIEMGSEVDSSRACSAPHFSSKCPTLSLSVDSVCTHPSRRFRIHLRLISPYLLYIMVALRAVPCKNVLTSDRRHREGYPPKKRGCACWRYSMRQCVPRPRSRVRRDSDCHITTQKDFFQLKELEKLGPKMKGIGWSSVCASAIRALSVPCSIPISERSTAISRGRWACAGRQDWVVELYASLCSTRIYPRTADYMHSKSQSSGVSHLSGELW